METEDRGVVYVATRKENYLAEAFLSAHSIKDHAPDLPITLYTDLPMSAFAQSDCFDNVVALQTKRKYTSLWAEGQLDRIKSLINSPYKYTLHLDADTRVMSGEFINLFKKLQTIDIGMAICQPDVSKCSQWTGFSMFNVGLILFKKGEKTNALLSAWRDLTQEHFNLANQDELPEVSYLSHIKDIERRRDLLFMDQTSFVRLLSPEVNKFDLDLEILGESWNFRGAKNGRRHEQPVKINHHPSLREKLGQDIIERAKQYKINGNKNHAVSLYQTLHDELIPPENQQGRDYVMSLIISTY